MERKQHTCKNPAIQLLQVMSKPDSFAHCLKYPNHTKKIYWQLLYSDFLNLLTIKMNELLISVTHSAQKYEFKPLPSRCKRECKSQHEVAASLGQQ